MKRGIWKKRVAICQSFWSKMWSIPFPLKYFPIFPSEFIPSKNRLSKLKFGHPLISTGQEKHLRSTGQSSGGRADGGGVTGDCGKGGFGRHPAMSCRARAAVMNTAWNETDIMLACLDPKLRLQTEIRISSLHFDFSFPWSRTTLNIW